MYGLQNGLHFDIITPGYGAIWGLTRRRRGSVSRSAAGTLLLPRMSRSQIPKPSSQTPDLSSQIPDLIPRLNPARRKRLGECLGSKMSSIFERLPHTMARSWHSSGGAPGAGGSVSRSAGGTLFLPRPAPRSPDPRYANRRSPIPRSPDPRSPDPRSQLPDPRSFSPA